MIRSLLILFSLILSIVSVSSQELRVIIPNEDGYGINARILSRHFSKHHPDRPNVVVQSVPGAFGIVAANYIYNIAAKDGTVIGTFNKEVPMTGILGGTNVKFDSKFSYIGSNIDGRKDSMIIWSNRNQNITDFRTQQLIMGVEAGGTGSPSYVIQKLLDLNLKYVAGYPMSQQTRMALDRKEIEAAIYSINGIKIGKPEWMLPNSGVYTILQMGNGKIRHPDYKNVPTLMELISSEDKIEIANMFEKQFYVIRPFVAPPGIPVDKLNMLRKMFEDTLKDPEYLADAKKANIDVDLISGKDAEEYFDTIAKSISPKAVETLRSYYDVKN